MRKAREKPLQSSLLSYGHSRAFETALPLKRPHEGERLKDARSGVKMPVSVCEAPAGVGAAKSLIP